MKLSPHSEAIVHKLRLGERVESGSTVLGSLDDPALALLEILVDEYEDLSSRTGADQAGALRTYYAEHVQAETSESGEDEEPASAAESETSTEPEDNASEEPANWRLVKLRCRSIRGIAPPGEEFEFEFCGESNLIYGPNGSGKSSLLAAVVWVLTGQVPTDSQQSDDEAPMYRNTAGRKARSKLRDWPVVATLPDTEAAESARPDCWAELELTSSKRREQLWLRRVYGKELEISENGVDWTVCDSLVGIGIAPLDIQLSLLAPTVFGRTTIEDASNTRNLLSLMLGFDDLEQLGELAAKLAPNRTRLEKAEREKLDEKLAALKQELARLAESLPDNGPGKQDLVALAELAHPSVEVISAAAKKVDSVLATAESELAKILGLEADESNPPAGMADQLTIAVGKLETGIWQLFPSLNSLRLDVALPPSDDATSEELLGKAKRDLEALIQEARVSIGERAEWWRDESTPGSKKSLLLAAAEFYDDETEACPVCGERIKEQELKDHLESLKHVDPRMRTELRTFFADLTKEVSEIVPAQLAALGKVSLSQAIVSDWEKTRRDALGKVFSDFGTEYGARVQRVSEELDAPPTDEINLLPEDVDDEFQAEAAKFLSSVEESSRALSLLEWGKTALEDLVRRLDEIIATEGEEDPLSLYAALSKGKDSAKAVKPLESAKHSLAQAGKSQVIIDSARERLSELETLKAPLENLKKLTKYAESEVRSTFDDIRDTTLANLRKLYETPETGLRIGRLELGKGRNKSVESLLSNDAYEVPGHFFANAGLQRAVALSFYFALLEKHERGMGFILMDDPILSLDEDHRERWSRHLLRPHLSGLQVVLATHQKLFLDRCREQFSADRVVELNPKVPGRRVSWHPGDRLRRAAKQLENDWRCAPQTMRKFREDALITFSAYSPEPFYDKDNLKGNLTKYAGFGPPHPLASKTQRAIVEFLRDPIVGQVLDPGSHALTEGDVTKPMAEDCLVELKKCEKKITSERNRLERRRKHALQGSMIPASVTEFPQLSASVTWNSDIGLSLIGAAAARSAPWTVDVSDDGDFIVLSPGVAVLVTADTMDPVARRGQWALLAAEDVLPDDGDLVAVSGADKNRYLRRIWSDGENWILQSVNPVDPLPSVLVVKTAASVRRLMGVVYEPLVPVSPSSGRTTEWLESERFDPDRLAKYRTILVEGDSLRPLAWPGQKVLVDEKYGRLEDVHAGTLAVVETSSEAIGNVIKRVFPRPDGWILVSPNPVDTIEPDILEPTDILSIRAVCGVLFETAEPSSS
jgi:recombinational DNA repair ATPase RecF